jgi:hypothetical protein
VTTTAESRLETASPGARSSGPSHELAGGPSPEAGQVPTHRWRALLTAAGLYLMLAVFVWWNVWSSHPTSTTTCGCGDSSLFIWFLEWPAHALSHGLNPLYSTALFYPHGVNLLANTSELAFGVVLTPVTWLFGPVATLNVALTLSPVLSALAMFVLLRRWVTWMPAAFVGGLFYGFSPLILVSLTDGHLMIGMAAVPPLVVACLDELLLRQRREPIGTGVVLGLLVTVQFFIGSEVLATMVMVGVIGVVLVMAWGALRPDVLRRHARHALVGLAAGGITAVLLLAYPVWFALAGPAHISGRVWPDFHLGYKGTVLKSFVVPAAVSQSFTHFAHRVGGYQGPNLSGQYFGLGVVAVLVGGVSVWWRDRRLWLFGAIAAVSAVFSWGAAPKSWRPWQLFSGLPQLENIIPSRFVLITYLAVAAMLGLIVDHVFVAVRGQRGAKRAHATERRRRHSSWAAAAGLVVVAVAVVPPAAYLAQSTPITVQPVVLPTWFRIIAPHLRGHPVLLVFPVTFSVIETSMAWQAVSGMPYSMVGGGGPGGVIQRAGKERPGQAAIGNVSFSFIGHTVTTDDMAAASRAIDDWGVTMVVLPDQPGLPAYDQVSSPPAAAALIAAATGRPPIHQADAWVWRGVNHIAPHAFPTTAAFAACTAASASGTAPTVEQATACVLAAARPATAAGASP